MTEMDTQLFSRNLESINVLIQSAARRAGRSSKDVKLIAVSKLQPVEKIRIALECGITDFGENYPEETYRKINDLPLEIEKIRFHMIGHLQSRKARIVANQFHYIHSIDSFHVAQVLSSELEEADRSIDGLIELNLTGESSKTGFPAWDEGHVDECLQNIGQILLMKHINLIGLMTMPPLAENPESSRKVYQELKSIQKLFSKVYVNNSWNELSMGTSFDYEVAIEEGSTMVRVGQALFGPR
jgi:pyridoxal phosphate enzyme (YggS family)